VGGRNSPLPFRSISLPRSTIHHFPSRCLRNQHTRIADPTAAFHLLDPQQRRLRNVLPGGYLDGDRLGTPCAIGFWWNLWHLKWSFLAIYPCSLSTLARTGKQPPPFPIKTYIYIYIYIYIGAHEHSVTLLQPRCWREHVGPKRQHQCTLAQVTKPQKHSGFNHLKVIDIAEVYFVLCFFFTIAILWKSLINFDVNLL
jgi:hypothetical protein